MVRLPIEKPKNTTPVEGVPHGSVAASASGARADGTYRLAMISGQPDISLRLVDLQASGRGGLTVIPFYDGTRFDVPGRFSPDGSSVAFVSNRNGSQQVYVARRDQSALRALTQLPDASVGVGSWSPNGKSVAFDAMIGGNADIYVVSVDGGPVTRLTSGAATEVEPEWSHDGQWIYFASDETGRSEIWRMSRDGRTRVQLTSEGGCDPHASDDGRYVYFVKDRRGYSLGPPTSLSRIPAQGGDASLVYSNVSPGGWGLVGNTVVFLVPGPPSSEEPNQVATYDSATQRVQERGSIGFRVSPYFVNRFLAISPDGRWALAPHTDRYDRDILVLDNAR
jgi:dipeptidyl aminopeptidase/acylaminoacyl peptidase